jgi:hypothetical protein
MGSQEPRQKMTRIIKGLNNQNWVSREGFRRTALKVRDKDTKYSMSTLKTFPITPISMTRSPISLTRCSAMDPNDLKNPEESQMLAGWQLNPINTTTGITR